MALVERRLRNDPLAADGTEAGEVATAAVQGVDALDTYFARYLPQVVLAALVPAAVLVWTAAVDPTSALIMLVTLPLIPVFMVLAGHLTAERTRPQGDDRRGRAPVPGRDRVPGLDLLRLPPARQPGRVRRSAAESTTDECSRRDHPARARWDLS
jgi:ABC-type transport system involved in cytochrome bd biosynthesis fused ATPase/permease subunit